MSPWGCSSVIHASDQWAVVNPNVTSLLTLINIGLPISVRSHRHQHRDPSHHILLYVTDQQRTTQSRRLWTKDMASYTRRLHILMFAIPFYPRLRQRPFPQYYYPAPIPTTLRSVVQFDYNIWNKTNLTFVNLEMPFKVSKKCQQRFYYPPEVRRGEYRGLGVFLLQYFPLVKTWKLLHYKCINMNIIGL